MVDTQRLNGSRFSKFVKFRDRFGLFLAAIMLVIYYIFLVAIGSFPEFLGLRIGNSSVSLGMIFGLGKIRRASCRERVYVLV